MNAEFKEGDEVYYKADMGNSKPDKKYRILRVEQTEASGEAKKALSQQQGNSLYGKEIEKISQPTLSFIIEPLSGGESIKVSQGEIELAQSK